MKPGDRVQVVQKWSTADAHESVHFPANDYPIGSRGTVRLLDHEDGTVSVLFDNRLPSSNYDGADQTWWIHSSFIGPIDPPLTDLSREAVEAWLDQPSASPGTP